MRKDNLKIWVDANVAITYLSGRSDKYAKECITLMQCCADEKVVGYIALHSVSIIWYYTRKLPADMRRQWLMNICTVLTVIGIDHRDVIDAIKRDDFADFEDCLQDYTAKAASCDYVITANIADFTHSDIPAITPDKFMEIIYSNESEGDWV